MHVACDVFFLYFLYYNDSINSLKIGFYRFLIFIGIYIIYFDMIRW